MNNRTWLNTLSDEEYANEWLKIEKMLHGDCGFHIEVIMQYLQAEHTTTADEDFAEIGYYKAKNDTNTYVHTSQIKTLQVGRNGNGYWTKPNYPFTDVLIDKIRTIADKKRKELGWQQWTKF